VLCCCAGRQTAYPALLCELTDACPPWLTKQPGCCLSQAARRRHSAAAAAARGAPGPAPVCKQGRTGRAGVQNVDVDLPTQKVTVTGDVSQDAVLETVAKSGKKTELWR